MKKGIHPEYHEKMTTTCSCGATLETGSTRKTMQVEICSQCHPFYTGKKRLVDTTGRVDRFKKLAEKSVAKKEVAAKAKAEKKAAAEKKETKEKKAAKKKPAAKK